MLIGVLISSAVGAASYMTTFGLIESDSRMRFVYHAQNAQNSLDVRIKSYTDVLRGAASLFQTGESLTRNQFQRYVNGLELKKHYPAIHTINFARYVRAAELAAFERQVRRELGQDFPGASVTPAGPREDYCVLTYIDGTPVAKQAFGLDIAANPMTRRALMDSRDTGMLLSSGIPIPAMSGPNRTGLAMRLPVYRIGTPLSTVEERRAAYIGSVGIAISVNTLAERVIDQMALKHLRVALLDTGLTIEGKKLDSQPRERLLYDSGAGEANPRPAHLNPADEFTVALPLNFNGRLWKAVFSAPTQLMYSRFDEYFPLMAMAAGFLTTALFYALFHTMISSRRRAIAMAHEMTRELRDSEAALQLSHQKLRRLAAHAERIKEGERKRIAREIHDDLGQNLLALRIEADMLATRTAPRHQRLHERARATLAQIDATIRSVRQIINDLRPNVLDLGLNAAVEWQVSEFIRRTGIRCALSDTHREIHLNDSCATAVFRILQESLSNIVRHAKATEVRVELALHGNDMSMSVSDNGIGIQAGGRNKAGSFGLVGIEERINILGGSFSITSIPGEGTTVHVSIPIEDNRIAAPGQSYDFAIDNDVAVA